MCILSKRQPGILLCASRRSARSATSWRRNEITFRSYAHKRACIGLIAEVDACLDDEYNAHQAEKEYPRMHFNANLANTYNCVTFYLFTPEQIRCIRDVCMRRMPADRDQVWIRLPAKLKLKRFTWEEEILCFLYRLERQSYERDARKKIGVSSVTRLLLP